MTENNEDPLYTRLKTEALAAEKSEPAISCLLRRTVLDDDVTNFNQAVAAAIAHRLGSLCGSTPDICPKAVRGFINAALESEERVLGWTMAEAVREDVIACVERDPACFTVLEPLLFFKGFAALVLHRTARRHWSKPTNTPSTPSRFVSLYLQSQSSSSFGVDIHPAATIGRAIMLDHATGIVIGETAVVGDGCSFLHGVTLGGTGKDKGKDRHPKVGRDVLIGAGSSVLGNIRIGDGAKIGAGSVVLRPIPSGATAVGAPAKVLGRARESKPGSGCDASMKDVRTFHTTSSGTSTSTSTSTSTNTDRVRTRRMRKSKSLGFYEGNKVFRNSVEPKTPVAANGDAHDAQTQTSSPESTDPNRNISNNSSSSDEENKDPTIEQETNNPLDSSSSSSSSSSLKKSYPDTSEMCVWRSFGTDSPPHGTLNIYQIRRVLSTEGASESEIGEVFFSLVDDEPYICQDVLSERFMGVARKYTGLDEKCLDRALDAMMGMVESCREKKQKESQRGDGNDGSATTRPRRNSIPEDAKLNLDDSISYSSSDRALSLPTITSQVCFVESPDDDDPAKR